MKSFESFVQSSVFFLFFVFLFRSIYCDRLLACFLNYFAVNILGFDLSGFRLAGAELNEKLILFSLLIIEDNRQRQREIEREKKIVFHYGVAEMSRKGVESLISHSPCHERLFMLFAGVNECWTMKTFIFLLPLKINFFVFHKFFFLFLMFIKLFSL